MEIAELEAKKQNLFNLLEYNICRGKDSNKKKYSIQCLLGNIKEYTKMFGSEHWTIEHHGDDLSSIFFSAPTEQLVKDGFRELIRTSDFKAIYYVIDFFKMDGMKKNDEVKLFITNNKGKFTITCPDAGGIQMVETSDGCADFSINLVDKFLEHVKDLKLVKVVSLIQDSEELAKGAVYQKGRKFYGHVTDSGEGISQEYNTEKEVLENFIEPAAQKNKKFSKNKKIKVENVTPE